MTASSCPSQRIQRITDCTSQSWIFCCFPAVKSPLPALTFKAWAFWSKRPVTLQQPPLPVCIWCFRFSLYMLVTPGGAGPFCVIPSNGTQLWLTSLLMIKCVWGFGSLVLSCPCTPGLTQYFACEEAMWVLDTLPIWSPCPRLLAERRQNEHCPWFASWEISMYAHSSSSRLVYVSNNGGIIVTWWTLLAHKYLNIFFFLKSMYSFWKLVLLERGRESEREGNSLVHSLDGCNRLCNGLGQSQEPGTSSRTGYRDQNTWPTFIAFPRPLSGNCFFPAIIRSWTIRTRTETHMGCRYCRQWFYPLNHNTGPDI